MTSKEGHVSNQCPFYNGQMLNRTVEAECMIVLECGIVY